MDRILISQVNDVFYLDQFDGNAHIRGTLHLTLTHVFFVGTSRKQEIWLQNQLISSAERLPLTTGGAPLIIRGKNFRVIRLLLLKERECHDVYVTLTKLAHVSNILELPCFCYVPNGCYWSRDEGWFKYPIEAHFNRFGLPNSNWILSDVNKNFEICDTYPTVLCVPSIVSQNILFGSSRFRSRDRFPVLTYLHPNGYSALCRSSQPLAGFSSKSTEDQILLDAILKLNHQSTTLYVVDTRPAINALTNRAQGKGYEDTNVYKNVVIQFFDIENIHVMRASLEKLLKVCQNPTISVENYISGIEKSGWLKHLRAILESAFFVAKRLDEGSSVLVHCSDGWDRTAQVCSLAQIVLDPYYRTIDGLQALIEKDWIMFGHKFTDRCGILLPLNADSREMSPIFTQFLDCIRHLVELCPTKFEYDTKLLELLHDHAYLASYGTFIGCSDKERKQLRVADKTYSLWTAIDKRRTEWTNPFYEHHYERIDLLSLSTQTDTITCGIDLVDNGKGTCRFAVDMLPNYILTAPLFRLWSDLFVRFEWRLPKSNWRRKMYVLDELFGLQSITEHNRLLETRIRQLQLLLRIREKNGTLTHDDSTPSDELTRQSHPISSGLPLLVSKSESDSTVASDELRQSLVSIFKHRASCHRKTLTFDFIGQLVWPSISQLDCEKQLISTNWVPLLNMANSTCSNCQILLVLSDRLYHCHACGKLTCESCSHFANLQPSPSLLSLKQECLHLCPPCHAKLKRLHSDYGIVHISQTIQSTDSNKLLSLSKLIIHPVQSHHHHRSTTNTGGAVVSSPSNQHILIPN